MANLNDIYMLAESIRRQVEDLPSRISIAGNQVSVRSLSEVSDNLGTIIAGEFRSGNGVLPTQGFTGLRIGYPLIPYDDKLWNLAVVDNDNLIIGLSGDAGEFRLGNGLPIGGGFSGLRLAYPAVVYNNTEWNLAGVDNDQLTVGIRSSDGVLVAAHGNVELDDFGINFREQYAFSTGDRQQLTWLDSSDNAYGYIRAFDGPHFQWEMQPTSTGATFQNSVSWMLDGVAPRPTYATPFFRIYGSARNQGDALDDIYLYLQVQGTGPIPGTAGTYGQFVIRPTKFTFNKPVVLFDLASSDMPYDDVYTSTGSYHALRSKSDGLYEITPTSTGGTDRKLAYSTDVVPSSDIAYPNNFKIFFDELFSSPTLVAHVNTSQPHNMYWITDSDVDADSDEYLAYPLMSTGTWSFDVSGITGASLGMTDLLLDDHATNGLTPHDWYAATLTVDQHMTVSGISVTTPGKHSLSLKVHGKNASATEYRVGVTCITAKRTA